MTKTTLKLFTGSILLSTLLTTGCGGGASTSTTVANDIQPHKVTRTNSTDQNSTTSVDQWQNYVSISSIYDKTVADDHKFSMDITFEQGVSENAKHFQVYLNTDANQDTGFSIGSGDCATLGADFMFEDGKLFKSTSNTEWKWSYVDEIEYKAVKEANNLFTIKLSGNSNKLMSIFDIDNIKNLNVSIEPVDENWEDTNNFVSEQNISMKVLTDTTSTNTGDSGTQQPAPVQPAPVQPVPADETLYEDAENSISANWVTIKGQYTPQRKTPGYKSKGFVKLQNEWIPLGNDLWENKSEYQLPMNNSKNQTILSVDLLGDGLQMQHYTLGVKVTTQDGERIIQWDSFFNHEKLPAERKVYDNGAIIITLPSPVEMVRGYGFADVNLIENFRVDIQAALKQFEPDNSIVSVDTFIATGGNLDNIKLMSK